MSRPDALEQELYETVADKQAFQVKLRQLRSEVRLVEASLEALQQKESWLTHELAKRTRVRTELPSVDDFVQGRALESAIPKFFDLDQEPKEPEELRSDEGESGENAGESQSQKAESDDWEEMLESLGVARCGYCGLRLPLDIAAIEQHSKCCPGTGPNSPSGRGTPSPIQSPPKDGLTARCSNCGDSLSMDMVEQHVCRRSESSCHDEVFAACLQNPLESSYDSEGSSVLNSNYLSLGT
ncbi:unnamed protein product [Symbiodinium necroappetens]|uniref:Uncharacterized protein n=1 Tax=Symbiodinium necroappetens TaxID=1628268 RepID=A0A812QQ07_9DINO|nr:unnamed protein product [Symbiodinium necroappetens]